MNVGAGRATGVVTLNGSDVVDDVMECILGDIGTVSFIVATVADGERTAETVEKESGGSLYICKI